MKKRSLILLLVFSLFFNLLFITGISFFIYKKGGFSFLKSKITVMNNKSLDPTTTLYLSRTSLFNQLPINNKSTVFIGDSLTQRNEWSEMFNNVNIQNRGIDGDQTSGILKRLNQVLKYKPEQVFILIGINDLLNGKSTDEVINNYKDILKDFREQSPDTKIYVQSILPVNNNKYGQSIKNDEIKALNNKLEKLSKTYNTTYIDICSSLLSNGELDAKYTYDGLHLNGDGYLVWKHAIEKYVAH